MGLPLIYVYVIQVLNLQNKLTRLEQEREHWILETQLLQMKYDKAAQVCGVLANNSRRSTYDIFFPVLSS